VIFAVFFEVAGQTIDARSQKRDLDFGRPGVALGALIISNDLRLGFIVESHMRLLLSRSVRQETADYIHWGTGVQGPALGADVQAYLPLRHVSCRFFLQKMRNYT